MPPGDLSGVLIGLAAWGLAALILGSLEAMIAQVQQLKESSDALKASLDQLDGRVASKTLGADDINTLAQTKADIDAAKARVDALVP